MNLQEYEKVRDFTYLEYCDYLQQKYGIGRGNYMTKSWNKNPKVSRTKEGQWHTTNLKIMQLCWQTRILLCKTPLNGNWRRI